MIYTLKITLIALNKDTGTFMMEFMDLKSDSIYKGVNQHISED